MKVEEFRRRWRDNDWSGVGTRPLVSRNRIEFTVPGVPRPKARPRVTGHGTYTPKRTKEYQGRVRARFLAEVLLLPAPWDGPVMLGVHAYGARWNADLDNIVKAVADALNGVAYKDDRQIQETVAAKYPVDVNGPRTVIVVMRLDAAGLREQWKGAAAEKGT